MQMSSGNSVYETWQVGRTHVGDVVVTIASKPGVLAHGTADAPAGMLADAVAALAPALVGARSLHLGSGNGLVPAVAQAVGFVPLAFDRSIANAEATRRSLQTSAPSAATVYHAALVNPHVPAGSCALATIRIPTDKLGGQLAVAEAFRALAVGGRCLLAGANDEGAKPAARLLEQLFGTVRLDDQHSGCRLVSAVKSREEAGDAALLQSPWLDGDHFLEQPVVAGGTTFTLASRPGVFSWQHLDEASGILADVMRIDRGERVLDLGCGAGVLGVVAARLAPEGTVCLLDADSDAVRCAQRTARLADCRNVEVLASDVCSAVTERTFDVVVSNPPFHLGKNTDLAIPRAFIEQAYARLPRGGRLYLVANRTLPYERLIGEVFGEVRTAHDGQRFKVIGGVRRA